MPRGTRHSRAELWGRCGHRVCSAAGPPVSWSTELAGPCGFQCEGEGAVFLAVSVARDQRTPHSGPESMCWSHRPSALRRTPEWVVGSIWDSCQESPGQCGHRTVGGLGVGHLSRPLEGHGQVDDIEWQGRALAWLGHWGGPALAAAHGQSPPRLPAAGGQGQTLGG